MLGRGFFFIPGGMCYDVCMEGITNIIQGNFTPEDQEGGMTPKRRQEIFNLADTMHRLEHFLQTATVDEPILQKIRTAMPVFTSSMYDDVLASTPERWAESPEYFTVITEVFILPKFEEMQLYRLFRDDLEAVEAVQHTGE